MKIKFEQPESASAKAHLIFSDIKSDCVEIEKFKEKKVFSAKKGEVFSDQFSDSPTLYAGLGERKKLSLEVLRLAGFSLAKEAQRLKLKTLSMKIPSLPSSEEEDKKICYGKTCKAIAEGFFQAQTVTDRYKTEKETKTLETVYFELEKKPERVAELVAELEQVMYGVESCRRLLNERSNTMTPSILAQEAKKILEPLGVEVEIFDKKKLEALKTAAFLEVARGSDEEPKGIVMRWKGNPSSDEKIGLVGKGLTYDAGGYCIKTPDGMSTMHTDMGGAAAVIGAMEAIARNKLNVNVTAVSFACENLISGSAYKTGDIISSMKGTTIYIGNTDAEGRLTLADALYYMATIEKPARIIDLATLTGAVVVALGNITTGVVSNNQNFASDFVKHGELTGEAFHILPLNDDYREMVKHDTADISNMAKNGSGAGSITAGAFLENFVEGVPWIHLDIAGTADGKARGYLPNGAHGVPVKTLYSYIKTLDPKNGAHHCEK